MCEKCACAGFFLTAPVDDLEICGLIDNETGVANLGNPGRLAMENIDNKSSAVARESTSLENRPSDSLYLQSQHLPESNDGSFTEISKHECEYDLLRESERRFRLLYENMPLSYQSLDADGRFIEINAAWTKLLGYAREEVIGKSFGDFLMPHSKGTIPRTVSKI